MLLSSFMPQHLEIGIAEAREPNEQIIIVLDRVGNQALRRFSGNRLSRSLKLMKR